MKILKEAPCRIRKLKIYFKFYKEDDMLLRHIGFFSCLKVEEQTEFNTVSVKLEPTTKARKEYRSTLDMMAVQTFDKMMGMYQYLSVAHSQCHIGLHDMFDGNPALNIAKQTSRTLDSWIILTEMASSSRRGRNCIS